MAGLEPLARAIYHEKQQPGSMLCAQHALNSLLQGNYFTAPDLSDIARHLDSLEESYDDSNTGHSSTNMDDTGFFSVQVLDNALEVWGLNLVRWRREDMHPYHDHPHTQLAFILNLEQHWFTLRRFGPALPNMDEDIGEGHWFNLNSFLEKPEWVGKLYLAMVLQQAEAEGYSVFVIAQADSNAPLALPRTEADLIAATLPEPTSAAQSVYESFTSRKIPASTSSSKDHIEGFEDEDYELQVALQASLSGSQVWEPPYAPPPLVQAPIQLPTSIVDSASPSPSSLTPHRAPSLPPDPAGSVLGLNIPGHADVDPVTASMERNRVMLQRMREQQEFAQRELWSDVAINPEQAAELEARRERRRRQEEQEEQELRRAIEESEALARLGEGARDEMDSGDMDVESLHPRDTQRVYDDDDAELQAALQASLENAPYLELPVRPSPSHPVPSASNILTSSAEKDRAEEESVMSDDTSLAESSTLEPLSVDEIRKRRLARFEL